MEWEFLDQDPTFRIFLCLGRCIWRVGKHLFNGKKNRKAQNSACLIDFLENKKTVPSRKLPTLEDFVYKCRDGLLGLCGKGSKLASKG